LFNIFYWGKHTSFYYKYFLSKVSVAYKVMHHNYYDK
jgi:hypothetical protein